MFRAKERGVAVIWVTPPEKLSFSMTKVALEIVGAGDRQNVGGHVHIRTYRPI